MSERFDPTAPVEDALHRRDGRYAVRLGLAEVASIGKTLAARIVEEREQNGDYTSQADLARRVGLTAPQLESLAAAGAFASLGLAQREALWGAGKVARAGVTSAGALRRLV